ncbi:MAG: sigma-70 family RNA polymerase sigma factor [Acidimicrobiia bacterium]|nr:sigma-70 family RNA polymerase sigma factor [Acidimicrobiia bacterium]MYL08709.1 sigma-70 family RNA polymerase sigma factor [Acidimicrobiia bacterium]
MRGAADDTDLVKKAQKGEQAAFDALLRRHYNQIYAVCRRLAGNEADALDATQEALITLVRRIDRFDGRSKFTTWMHRVVVNACLDELRRRGRRPVPTAVEEQPLAAAERPVAEVVADRLDIESALAQLPGSFRVPLVLCDQLGMSYEEIAQEMDIPPGTVRSRISRGRRRLAEVLSGNPEGPGQRHTGEKP